MVLVDNLVNFGFDNTYKRELSPTNLESKDFVIYLLQQKRADFMIILKDKLTVQQLSDMAAEIYGDMIKAVVDVREGILAIDADLHSDLERMLLENGSRQEDLWGFNIYPEVEGDDFIEFDSLINIRPRQNNHSRGVEDESIQLRIREIVDNFVIR